MRSPFLSRWLSIWSPFVVSRFANLVLPLASALSALVSNRFSIRSPLLSKCCSMRSPLLSRCSSFRSPLRSKRCSIRSPFLSKSTVVVLSASADVEINIPNKACTMTAIFIFDPLVWLVIELNIGSYYAKRNHV